MEGVYLQSDISTAVVFAVSLGLLFFFQELIGLKGIVRILVAVGIAFLYRYYWGTVWDTVVMAAESLGLVVGS